MADFDAFTTTCGSCPAQIVWALTPKAKSSPIDAEPSPDGNVRLTMGPIRPIATTLAALELEAARMSGEPLHLSHFATCPDADRYRKGKR